MECDLSFVAYRYAGATSLGNSFAFGSVEIIPLNQGNFGFPPTDAPPELQKYEVVFNTSGLPEFRVSSLDISALLTFFQSSSFSGAFLDGETTSAIDPGITAALQDPKRNISQAMTAMAQSMTDQLRSSYNATAVGLVSKSKLIVRIRWPWMILPWLVVFTAAVFLLVTITESGRSDGTPIWKDSSTALLFHTVNENNLIPNLKGSKDLKAKVEGGRMQLQLYPYPPAHELSRLSNPDD